MNAAAPTSPYAGIGGTLSREPSSNMSMIF